MGMRKFRGAAPPFSKVACVVKGYIFLSGNRRYTRVFKLLAHLGIKAHLAVLPRVLYCRNLPLLERPSCLNATAFHKVFIEFPFRLSQDFKKG